MRGRAYWGANGRVNRGHQRARELRLVAGSGRASRPGRPSPAVGSPTNHRRRTMRASPEATPRPHAAGAPHPAADAAHWSFACSACEYTAPGADFAAPCPRCGQPLFVRYPSPLPGRGAIAPRWDMWRYRALLPVRADEEPLSLGEGCTPLTEEPGLARTLGARRLWVKNEAVSPTTSFKARGMSASVTRVRHMGFRGLVVPTNGNAGVALAAYAAAAGIPARVY